MFPQKLGSGSSAHSSALDLDGISRQQVLASRDRDGPGAQRDGRFEGRPLPNADIRRSKCWVGSGGLRTQPFPQVLSKIRGSELTETCRACGSCSGVWGGRGTHRGDTGTELPRDLLRVSTWGGHPLPGCRVSWRCSPLKNWGT